MQPFIIHGVEEERVKQHHELFPSIWKKSKSLYFSLSRLRLVLTKTWIFETVIISLSVWNVHSLAVPFTLEYNRTTKSCEVTLNAVRGEVQDAFAKALVILLASKH